MLRSSFAGFTTAQLAMRASQRALDVTGQNIANINTIGYTRQRLDTMSLNMGGSGRYATDYDAYIGHGVLVTGVSQLRDPFLDKRFRTEIANVGQEDNRLASLNDLKSIFDEVAKTGLQDQITDLTSRLQDLSSQVGNKEFDSMVKSSAEVLTKLFNDYAGQLESVRADQEYNLKDIDVPSVNNLLEEIKELNKTIKAGQITGNDSLELQDQRNQKLDELASYVNIDVKYTPVQVSPSTKVEVLSVNLVAKDGTKIKLIDDGENAQFDVINTDPDNTANGEWQINLKGIPGGAPDETNLSFSTGSLKSSLEMLNCAGEYDAAASSPRGLKYYANMLDSLANKFATEFNKANNLAEPGDAGYGDLDLFAANDGGAEITAKNIGIASGWSSNKYGITTTKKDDTVTGDKVDPDTGAAPTVGKNENVLHMIALLSKKLDYTQNLDGTGDSIFNGSFHECFTNMGAILGIDIKSTTGTLNNYVAVARETSNSRDSISSVSLDEEGVDILRFQKSFNAAARLMTALDENLDKIINGMGVVGR